RGLTEGVVLDGAAVGTVSLGEAAPGVDLTRWQAPGAGGVAAAGGLDDEKVQRAQALAQVVTAADILGAARGAFDLACVYAKMSEQYVRALGSPTHVRQ